MRRLHYLKRESLFGIDPMWKFFTIDKAQMSFGLRHYAGEVLYDCTELLVKNADSVNADHEELMTAMSKFTFLQDLFQTGKMVRALWKVFLCWLNKL